MASNRRSRLCPSNVRPGLERKRTSASKGAIQVLSPLNRAAGCPLEIGAMRKFLTVRINVNLNVAAVLYVLLLVAILVL